MMKLLHIPILITLFATSAFGQAASNKNYKLGIKTAINLSSLQGTELKNPSLRFGYSAGAYYRQELSKKYHFQAELLGNFKGSHFKNGDGEYNSIATFYVDFPLLLARELGSEDKMILLGPQIGFLGLSSMYLVRNSKSHTNDVGLRPMAIDACLAYQQVGVVAGWQLGVKYGLLNINKDLFFEDINPPTGNGGTIYSLSLELGLIF